MRKERLFPGMLKPMWSASLVLVAIGITLWVWRGGNVLTSSGGKPVGPVGTADVSRQPMSGGTDEESDANAEARESARHAANDMEKHRQSRVEGLGKAIRDLEAKVEERRQLLATVVQVGTLLKYEDKQFIAYAAGLDLPGNAIKDLQPLYQESSRHLDLLKQQGIGEIHPTRLAKNRERQEIELQLKQEAVRLKAVLEAQMNSAMDRLKGGGTSGKNPGGPPGGYGPDSQDFLDAQAGLERDQQNLHEMKLRQGSPNGDPAPPR